MNPPLINKVVNKAIIQIDLEKWIPSPDQIMRLDIKQFLFKELVLKESEFREQVEQFHWATFAHKYVVLEISNNAIVPQWAYLIIAEKLAEVQASSFSDNANVREQILVHIILTKDLSEYQNKRILVKGCGQENLSNYPYILLTQRLKTIAKAFSFGESCSMVPIFKN